MWNRHRILAVAAVGLCAALWTYACGDGTTDPPPPDPLRATTVTVTPATAELTSLGETVRFTAQVLNQNGQAMAGAPVAWSSSDASVATVDASGLATTAGNGTATITATSGSASGTAAVTVAQTVSTVAVSPAADTLVALGDTVRLTAEASDANGHAVAGAEFTWASGDTAVATVDASGLVTSAGAGQAEVTATASGVAGGAAITVVDPAPTTVAVTPDMVALTALGRTAQLVAEVRDQVGRVMEGVPVAWSSSDTTVATVDSAGLVTAVGGGASTVAASAGEASGEALVTVMQAAGSVVVTPTVDTVALGDTLRLVAEAFDGNGHAIADAEFEWSSSDVSVATVDDSGLVRGVAEGAATITAASGGARGTAAITVENPDRAALVALYNATNGPNWVDNTNWLTDAPLHQWYGVSADASGRVLGLSLSGQSGGGNYRKRHGLSGSVPAELGNLSNLRTLDLGVNRLTGPIPAELGNLAQLRTLWLAGNHLTGTIPTELGNLAHLEALSFSGNRLTGPIPPELGNLGDLRSLYLRNNALSGPIPRNFLELDRLSTFFIVGNEALCVPGSSAFVAWLRGLEYRDGDSLCNAADAAVLGQLYELAGGTGWNRSHGWAGDGALEEWHGVSADSLGHVTALDLTANGLAGQLPPTLGELTRMTELRVADNPGLSGRLPLSLANLSLAELRYAGTGLCVPANQSFEDWLNTISSHDGTGAECAPLSDREILEILYEATGGPDWLNSENWLTDAPLSAWHGVVGDEGRVVELSLSRNNLAGLIPPELGDLASLRRLDLAKNDLEGTIPPELGDLASLGRLDLAENNLEGTIPPELGDLAYMWGLYLAENDLEGTIPPELGRLSRLHTLNLFDNRLAGPIPPGLGNLDRLQWLYLNANDLAGAIPPELGNLDRLQRLYLNANDLAGAIPPELGNLGRLSRLSVGLNNLEGPLPLELGNLGSLLELGLAGNAGLSGALPSTLTRLGDLEALVASGTNLCAPRDPGFRRWLDGVETRHVKLCDGGGPAAAYLVQAVQSRELPVPLVARREALLRIFVTAAHDNNERLPPVRASFYHGGALAHVADIAAGTGRIPTEVDEGSLAASANVTVPAEVVLPDLEMVIEIDPDGTLDSGLGVAKRIPETGRLPVEVREMPRFELTLIPFIWTEAPDSTILDAVTSTVADPEEWLWG
ncbi:Ig-like domain-containing protein [Candidatus Palauibacter sp.]|uniref:Ig-like domain-containing protein n=1 Tax=Candidatus Palauibacter sp. TaxID=3101350 RepID=UPI003B013A24